MLKCGETFSRSVDGDDADEAAVAGYIAEMTAQLETMAAAAGLDLLAYFLAMARAEGEAAMRAAPAPTPAALGSNDPAAAGGRAARGPAPRSRSFRASRSRVKTRRPPL
jgi:hypothetical protein